MKEFSNKVAVNKIPFKVLSLKYNIKVYMLYNKVTFLRGTKNLKHRDFGM